MPGLGTFKMRGQRTPRPREAAWSQSPPEETRGGASRMTADRLAGGLPVRSATGASVKKTKSIFLISFLPPTPAPFFLYPRGTVLR